MGYIDLEFTINIKKSTTAIYMQKNGWWRYFLNNNASILYTILVFFTSMSSLYLSKGASVMFLRQKPSPSMSKGWFVTSAILCQWRGRIAVVTKIKTPNKLMTRTKNYSKPEKKWMTMTQKVAALPSRTKTAKS